MEHQQVLRMQLDVYIPHTPLFGIRIPTPFWGLILGAKLDRPRDQELATCWEPAIPKWHQIGSDLRDLQTMDIPMSYVLEGMPQGAQAAASSGDTPREGAEKGRAVEGTK